MQAASSELQMFHYNVQQSIIWYKKSRSQD